MGNGQWAIMGIHRVTPPEIHSTLCYFMYHPYFIQTLFILAEATGRFSDPGRSETRRNRRLIDDSPTHLCLAKSCTDHVCIPLTYHKSMYAKLHVCIMLKQNIETSEGT